MKNFELDENFREAFKKVSLKNKGKLLAELSGVFELPEFHFSRCVLNRYYKKIFEINFNKDLALRVLLNFFGDASFSIFDYSAPCYGGYPIGKREIVNDDELIIDSLVLKDINSNWFHFVLRIKDHYWENEENIDAFLKVSNFDLYEDRLPKNQREKMLASYKTIVDGEEKNIKYNFFDISRTLSYYIKLINMFFPDFTLVQHLSNKKVKRFGKKIANDIFVGLYVDFSFLEKELSQTYLELPQISVEVFSSEINSFIKEEVSLVNQSLYPIGRINLYYFMGNPISTRIGSSFENEEILKKDLFFYMNTYAFYLKKYIRVIEYNINEVLFSSGSFYPKEGK